MNRTRSRANDSRSAASTFARPAVLALAAVLLTAGLAALSAPAAASHEGSAIVVDDDGDADFASLQAAVDHAAAGDTIEVEAGTYAETVTVDKPVEIVGTDRSSTILDGDGAADPTLAIAADGVSLTELTIQNPDGSTAPLVAVEGDAVLDFNRIDGTVATAEGIDADLRLNDWGLDTSDAVEDQLTGAGTALFSPFLLDDGTAEPGLPVLVGDAHHSQTESNCIDPDRETTTGGYDADGDGLGDTRWIDKDGDGDEECVFATIQAAVDFAHPDVTVAIPASDGGTLTPNTYDGPATVDRNNCADDTIDCNGNGDDTDETEAERLTGLRICSTSPDPQFEPGEPVLEDPCAANTEQTVVDAEGEEAFTVQVEAEDVTIQGLTIQNSGLSGFGGGIKAREAPGFTLQGSVLEGNVFEDESPAENQRGVQLHPDAGEGYQIGGPDAEDANTFSRWDHAGVAADANAPGTIEGNTFTEITRSAIKAGTDASPTIVENTFETNGLRAISLSGTQDAVVRDNAITLHLLETTDVDGEGSGVWVHDGAQDTLIEANDFEGQDAAAVEVSACGEATCAAETQPDGLRLRENQLNLTNAEALIVNADVEELTVDARLNDWSVYDHELVAQRATDDGSDNVLKLVPFLLPDGSPDPALPIVADTGETYVGVQEAVDAAGPEGTVLLPGSSGVDATPYVESVTIPHEGLRLCAAPGGDACRVANDQVAVQGRATDEPAIRVTADEATVAGLGLEGSTLDTSASAGLLVGDTAKNARVQNVAADGLGTGIQVDGDDAEITANTLTANDVGIAVTGTDVATADNELTANTLAVELDEARRATLANDRVNTGETGGVELAAGEAGVQPTDVTVNNTRLETTTVPLALTSGTQGLTVEATCNDWGAYHRAAIEERILDEGQDNTVEFQPWQGPNPDVTLDNGCLVEPVSSFTYEPEEPTRLDEVQFNDTSRPGSAPIVFHEWDFGDGDTSRMANPTHSYDELGSFEVELTVEDAEGMRSTTTRTVTVGNLAPALEAPIAVESAHEQDLSVNVSASSEEGDAVELSASGTPLEEGATFSVEDQGTAAPVGTLAWTDIDARDRGTYVLEVTARDEHGAETTDQVEITVTDDGPVIEPVPDPTTRLGHEVTFTANATDANGDPVELTASNVPSNATFTVENQTTAEPTATFAWTPTEDSQVGEHNITLAAEAEGLTDTQMVTVTVGEENQPPAIAIERGGSPVGDTVT
ncbi:hypothetical protein BRD56_08925, partial [Thermoplasmatales archaeon SW_10_69_26]